MGGKTGFGRLVGRWWPVLALLAFPGVLLWRPLFGGQVFFWGTPLLQFVPWQRMAAGMWRSGQLPLWNPLVGCGTPLAANYQTAAFYPLNVLYLLLPAEVAMVWTAALHLALAGWGMYAWGRAAGLDRFPAFVGAVSPAGSGFLVTRVALFPSMVLTFPWLAVWLWRAEMLAQRRRLSDALWLGLSLGLGLLAGHAQTAFYGGLLLAAYVTFRTVQEARSKKQEVRSRTQGAGKEPDHNAGPTAWGLGFRVWDLRFGICYLVWPLCAAIVGLGLAAIQLLPTAELMAQSQRAAGVDYDLAMTYSFWPWRLITFAAPDFFGNPGRGTYWGYATYWEDAGYVGVLPLLLAVEAVLSRKRRRDRSRGGMTCFWAVCAVGSLILALGKNTPVFPFLFHHVPSFDLFQAPARWLAVTTIALAALAALGAQWRPTSSHGRRRGGLAIVLGIAFLLGGVAAPQLVSGLPSTFGPATARLGGTLAVAGALTLLQDGPAKLQAGARWQVAAGAFIALDLLLYGWSLVPTVERSLYRGETATAAALRRESNPVRIYWPTDPTHRNREYDAEHRVKFSYLTFEGFGPDDVETWWEVREAQLPNAGMLDSIPSANNFDPLLVGRTADLLEAAVESPGLVRAMGVTHVASDQPWPDAELTRVTAPAALYRLPDALGRAWVVPDARWLSADETLATLTDPTFDPGAEVLLEPPAPPHSQPPARDLNYHVTLQDTPNRVTIRAILDAPGYLVLADTWFPGWQVTVDGVSTELLRANYAFRAVRLEAGDHRVDMVYRPASWVAGGAITMATLTLLTAGLLWAHKREVPA